MDQLAPTKGLLPIVSKISFPSQKHSLLLRSCWVLCGTCVAIRLPPQNEISQHTRIFCWQFGSPGPESRRPCGHIYMSVPHKRGSIEPFIGATEVENRWSAVWIATESKYAMRRHCYPLTGGVKKNMWLTNSLDSKTGAHEVNISSLKKKTPVFFQFFFCRDLQQYSYKDRVLWSGKMFDRKPHSSIKEAGKQNKVEVSEEIMTFFSLG